MKNWRDFITSFILICFLMTFFVNIQNVKIIKAADSVTLSPTDEAYIYQSPDSGKGTDNPQTIVTDGKKSVSATFSQDEYTLTVNVVGSGSVTINPEQATFNHGDSVELTANPDPHWSFVGWEGDLSDSINPQTIVMDSDKTVTAFFFQYNYTLSTSTVGNGSVTISPEQATFNHGDSVELTANPDTGWSFTGWSGDLSGTTSPQTIVMDDRKSVTATFTQDEYTLTINGGGNGLLKMNSASTLYLPTLLVCVLFSAVQLTNKFIVRNKPVNKVSIFFILSIPLLFLMTPYALGNCSAML